MTKISVLLAAAVALIAGSLSLQSCTKSQSSARASKVGEDEVCAMQLRLLWAGELQGEKDAVVPTSTAPATTGTTTSFELTSTIRGNGQPLPGVRIALRALWSMHKYDLTAGKDGVARIEGVIPGDYEVSLSHDSHVPLKASYGRSRTIQLPAPPASCEWTEVYVAGWSAVGSDSLASIGRVRYSDVPSLDQAGEVSRFDFEEAVQRLRARWGDYIHLCLPAQPAPRTRTVTIFDEVKGPCQFELPLTPLSSFGKRTECDLSSKPVVEAMSRLVIQIVDANDKPVDIGRLGIVRDTDYFGYREDRLFGNTTHVIPPGHYRVSTAGMVFPWQLPDETVELQPGNTAVARIRLPHPMREVVLITRGRAAIARVIVGETQGKPLGIQSRTRLWLPQGVTRMSFLYIPIGSRKPLLVQRELAVAATEDLQHITIALD